MPAYKFTYFNGRGRGENARLLMKLAGVEFEDNRIEFAEWPALKPKTPFGTLPILTVDGKTELTQAKAIGRYLARELGLYGETNLECAEIDCVMDMVDDNYEGVGPVMRAKDDAEAKAKAVAEFKQKATKMLANLEKKLSQCNDGKNFFIGTKMTVADIFAFQAMDLVQSLLGDDSIFADFPKLKSLRSRVAENKNIAAWIDSRPKTPF